MSCGTSERRPLSLTSWKVVIHSRAAKALTPYHIHHPHSIDPCVYFGHSLAYLLINPIDKDDSREARHVSTLSESLVN